MTLDFMILKIRYGNSYQVHMSELRAKNLVERMYLWQQKAKTLNCYFQ